MASKSIMDWVNAGKSDDFSSIKIPEIPEDDEEKAPKKPTNKRLSVERIYQKKTQLEHILLRPDTYIGSIEKETKLTWVYDEETKSMTQRELTYVPGLYKIFDEILVNAADNKQRDAKMNCIKIDIDPENNKVKIWNNGKGIPVVEHKTENMYVPTLIFGHLLTSSNYDDAEKKVTGGRNGFGAKLCNIFSTKFIVETSSKEYHKAFKQSWGDNMSKASEPKISGNKSEDYTSVTFHPDLKRFNMEVLDRDIVALFTRRAYDIAASSKGVKVYLNGERLAIKNFKDYIDLYIKDKTDDCGNPVKLVHEVVNDRWEVGVALSDKGFHSVSFVNSIATTKGGRHVDYLADQMVNKLIEVIKKKEKKGIAIKPFQVRNHIWVFANCLIENPSFDSQTKENMTLQPKNFGSKCTLSEKFVNQVAKCGIVEAILSWMKFKAQEKLNKKSGSKSNKLKGIPKLDDANDAGTKNSLECTLILTEGDSAKTLAVAGLGMIGRDRYGVFPLRGKLLNVREASHKQIMDNAEINNVIKICGLKYKEKYETYDTLKTLRYGKIMIMTDQDQDGSHIKGLLINFIHHNWPNLLKHNFVEEFITPIVKVTKQKEEISFYSLPEFEEWRESTPNSHTWRVKYYKGLGTSTSKEAKEYFSDMDRHRIPFKYSGTEDDSSIVLAFSKKKIEERKEWLTNWMEERKRRAQLSLPELYLYHKDTKRITFSDFVNRELILFSNMDNERSIPSLVDGLKPGQRKVLFTCLKRNLTREIKVAQLAGSVAELSAYHHGETSLMMTIVGLAQNFVGSNNINLLQPIGQFGTRLHGGKDAASPRYIFTKLSSLTRLLFHPLDDALLKSNFDDNQRIEPNYYVPIIPMVLVNGAEGIGTGWSTKIPNYNHRQVIHNLLRMLDEKEPEEMIPWYKNFKGTIDRIDETRYLINGEVAVLDDNAMEVTELPVKTWTQNYKENILEPMLQGTDKVPATISDYKEYHTDTTVKFVVKMSQDKLYKAEESGLHQFFKLQTPLTCNSMVLFDQNGVMKRYNNAVEIIQEFYGLRLELYERRKLYLEGMLSAESLKLDNQARFICEKIDGTIVIENKKKAEMIQTLVRRGYDSDPVKSWKIAQDKLSALMDNPSQDSQEEDEDEDGPDYNYLLGMPMWNLTLEKKEELLKNQRAKAEELYQLQKKTPKDLWRADLNALLAELDVVEAQEREDANVAITKAKSAIMGGKGRGARPKKIALMETKPSPMGRRVAPRIDTATRAKFEAAAKARKKKEIKREAGADMFKIEEDDETDSVKALDVPLAERLKASFSKEPKKETAAKKPAKGRAKTAGSPKKKGKKRNPWSESEDSDLDDDDLDDDPDAPVIPRETNPRRNAAAKVSKYCDNGDDSFDDSFDEDPVPMKSVNLDFDAAMAKPAARFSDDSDDNMASPVLKKPTNHKPKAPIFDDSDSDGGMANGDSPIKPSPAKATKAKPKAAPKKKAATSGSSSPPAAKKAKKAAKPKKAAAPKKKKKSPWSDSEEEGSDFQPDSDVETENIIRAAGSRAKKTVKYNFDDSDSDF